MHGQPHIRNEYTLIPNLRIIISLVF